MQLLKFLLSVLVLAGLILLGNTHQPFGSSLPRLGPLFSPFSGFWQNAEATAVPPGDALSFPQLKDQVSVAFDERLVPHIFAENVYDAAFVQGYLHARYRLWQMDISSRAASGRLSEVLGERTLERDRQQRRKGMMWAASRALKGWEKRPAEMALINAYTEGVNAYVGRLRPADYPLEFKLMGYAPEKWTPLKSAVFFKSMAETLSGRHDDLPATNSLLVLGDSLFQFLFPEYNPRQAPIVPDTAAWAFEPVPLEHKAMPSPAMIGGLIPHRLMPQPPPQVGSNNWAVAGSKTTTGRPILCSDPHLRLSLPSIWYETQFHLPETNAYGVSFPGVPGLLIGFNEYTAWGETNASHDVLDWFRIQWADEKKENYLYDGAARPVEPLVEIIKVRGRSEPVLDTVKYTVWGPIVYEDPGSPYHDMAMRWLAHDLPANEEFSEIGTFWKLMNSRTYEDYRQALHGFDNPAQNFAFAQRDGDIAITANGKLPLKRPQQGRFVQDGSSSGNAWYGFIPRGQVPHLHNPARGFVFSANQHSTGPGYPYYYNGNFDDYRARLIGRRLAASEKVSIEDMKALQLESYSIKAEEGVPLLLGLVDSTAGNLLAAPLVQSLKAWNFRFEANSRAATLFERWLQEAQRLTFDELIRYQDSVEVTLPETWRFLELLGQVPGHPIFDRQDTGAVEDASSIVTQALEIALAEELPDWGAYKGTWVSHLARIPAFSHHLPGIGGYKDAPNAITGIAGPSWRMVVALGEEVEAYGVYPGGQDGNPGSPYFDDMLDSWAAGEYYEIFFMQSAADGRQPVRFSMDFSPASK